jgi:hypothetical protein
LQLKSSVIPAKIPDAARIKNVLSSTAVSNVVIVVSFLARAVQLVFFYNIRVDASYQVMATDNLLHGHGISTAQVLAADLSQVVYTPLTQWPPGYSLLLAPFYALFNHRYIAAGLALDLLAALALILFSRKLLLLFRTPLYMVNPFTILQGFFIYYFYFIASSDAIAIAFFIAGIYFLFALLYKSHLSLRSNIGLTICLLFAGLIKYLFIPVAVLVPVFLAANGFVKRQRQLVKAGVISFAVLLFSFVTLIVYFQSLSGSVAYISAPERGLYPEHLTQTYPFLTASFVKPDTAALAFGEKTSAFFYAFSQWATLLLVIYLSIVLFRQVSKKSVRDTSIHDRYFVLAWLLSIAVVLELMVLSLFVAKEEILPGLFWTYVEEPRYYGLIYLLVHLGVFVFYDHLRNNTGKKLKVVFVLMLILLLPEFFRGGVFVVNRVRKFRKEEYSWQAEKRLQDYADSLTTNIRRQYKSVPVVVTGASYYYNHRISLTSHVPILYDAEIINGTNKLKTKRPVILLVVMHKDLSQHYLPFLRRHGQAPIGTFEDFSFYAIPVNPN